MSAKILIIDDSVTVVAQVQEILGGSFSITSAVDGIEGLERLDAHPDTSLIICDINMPRMTGLEFLEVRASRPELKRIPVVILSTDGQPDQVQRARALGANGWLVKPVRADHLLAVAQKATKAK